jgi:dTDP-glucose pyrophosphorylase
MGAGSRNLDGLIMTMHANDPKWSFVGLDESDLVHTVVEKEVISNEATVGIYNFKRGSDFVSSADQMINLNLRVNNEFYVAPVYNQLIKIGRNIGIYNIGKVGAGMHGLGTPDDLDSFLKHPISKKMPKFL